MSLTLPQSFRSPKDDSTVPQQDAAVPSITSTLLELAVIDASLEAHRKCLSTLERIAADLAKIKAEAGVRQ